MFDQGCSFLSITTTYNMPKLTYIYVVEIVKLLGMSSSIVSDRDPKFMLHFWGTLFVALGT